MADPPGVITLTAKGLRWHQTGHPWTYQSDLGSSDPAFSGEIVRVNAPNGRPLGKAFYNPKSKIALRWLTDDPDQPIDRDFWQERLSRALELRQRVVEESTAYRLVSSEADGLPGLIVDRYGPVLVLQSLSLGIDRILPLLVELLVERLQPEGIVARNDASVRTLEGLPVEKKVLLGKPPGRIEVKEGDRRYLVDVWEGQKTGAYLDQRENRLRARIYARGRVLDGFAYQGGFTLQVAAQAEQVLAIEDSEAAVRMLKENLTLNQITHVQVERANSFDRLKALDRTKEKFDLVILDPPAFAKAKKELADAWRGYREINLRALRILKAGGTLISCSCSYQVTDEIFLEVLRQASIDARRKVRLLEIRTQSMDHPVVLTHPESKYLKCLVLEVA
jgi:23S rRNA (cytosine1962-C5)-methyltransferase